MSDIRKWMKLMESIPTTFANDQPNHNAIKKNATVMVVPGVGGGVGRFMHYTPNGAMVDIKGVARELSSNEFSSPDRHHEDTYNKGNDWDHVTNEPETPGRLNDRPEFRPGDMVKVADVYGSVIGPGFGIFIAYSTSGEECIISFDNKEITVPTENVGSVVEQDAKDNFDEMDNDGNLSPMSFGSENIKIEEPEMDHRDEFSKWMDTVEEALTTESMSDLEEITPQAGECGCGNWNCQACFPEQGGDAPQAMAPEMAPEMGMTAGGHACPLCGETHGDDHEHSDQVGLVQLPMDMGMEEDEFDMDAEMGMEEDEFDVPVDETPTEKPRSGKGVKLGSIVQSYVPVGDEDSPLTHGGDMGGDGGGMEEEVMDFTQPQDTSGDEFGRAGRYQQDNFGVSEADDEGYEDFSEEQDETIQKIMYLQSMGVSNSDVQYSEEELRSMDHEQLNQCFSVVKGEIAEMDDMMPQDEMGGDMATGGTLGAGGAGGGGGGGGYPPGTAPTMPESIKTKGTMMEQVDKDVAAMMASLKKYDMLKESVAPVLMGNLSEKKMKEGGAQLAEPPKEVNVDPKLLKEKDKKKVDEEKSDKPWTDKSGKEQSGTAVKGKSYTGKEADKEKKKDVKETVEEGADPEVLEWMGRFAKLGNMKGYGR